MGGAGAQIRKKQRDQCQLDGDQPDIDPGEEMAFGLVGCSDYDDSGSG